MRPPSADRVPGPQLWAVDETTPPGNGGASADLEQIEDETMSRLEPLSKPSLLVSTAVMVPTHLAFVILMAVGPVSWWLGLAIMAVLQGVALAIVALMHRDVAVVTRYVDALVDGAPTEVPRPISRVARTFVLAIARLHRIDQTRRRAVQRQLDATARLIDSLSDPLLLIGPHRQVMRLNAAAAQMLDSRTEGADLSESVRHPEVLGAVDSVLAGGDPRTVEFVRPVPIEQVLQARIQPYDGNPMLVLDGGAGALGGLESDASGDAPALKSAVVTFHDITAIRRSEQMRADFVANASHELRTPLSTLMGFIETLRGPARDDADARDRFLSIMDEQSSRMSRLVNDLLSLSRIELDEHLPPAGEVDIGAVVRGVVATLELRAARRRMRLVVKAGHDLPSVYGDTDQLTQVVQNLVDNAINYAREDTDVVISAALAPMSHYRGDHAVLVSVSDKSDGIPKSHLSRLTERFYRVDPARSRAIGGTGLGLAIVKHIVNRHRGRLGIESELGKGSVFSVALPAMRPVVGSAQGAHTA